MTNCHHQQQPKNVKNSLLGPKIFLVPGNFLIYCFQFLKMINLVPAKIKSYEHCPGHLTFENNAGKVHHGLQISLQVGHNAQLFLPKFKLVIPTSLPIKKRRALIPRICVTAKFGFCGNGTQCRNNEKSYLSKLLCVYFCVRRIVFC